MKYANNHCLNIFQVLRKIGFIKKFPIYLRELGGTTEKYVRSKYLWKNCSWQFYLPQTFHLWQINARQTSTTFLEIRVSYHKVCHVKQNRITRHNSHKLFFYKVSWLAATVFYLITDLNGIYDYDLTKNHINRIKIFWRKKRRKTRNGW